jgi:hypothetical protein
MMMDFEALRTVWTSNANDPDAATRGLLVAQANATLHQRRTRLRRLLAFAGVMATIPLVLIGLDLSGQADIIDMSQEWGLIPLALIPLAVLIFVARRAMSGNAPSLSLIQSFRALRADNAAARLRIVIIAGSMVLFAPLLLVVLGQLVAAGKMAPHEMQSAAIVLGGALALSGLSMGVKYVAQLEPERRQLKALIEQYEAAASPEAT